MSTITTAHPLERAELGLAPFSLVGFSESVYVACPGAPAQAAGTCDYCGTGIRYVCHIRSADGKEFKVGMDCVRKLYRDDNAKSDAILVAVNDERRRLQREARHAKERQQLADGWTWVNEHRTELAALPHPRRQLSDLTMADYLEWIKRYAGTSGTLSAIRTAKRALCGNA